MRLRLFSDLEHVQRKQALDSIRRLNRSKAKSITIANDPRLLDVLEKTFGYKTDVAIFEVDDQLVGYFMFAMVGRRLVSMPHFSYAGFLAEPIHLLAVQTSLRGFLSAMGAPYLFRGDLIDAPFHYDGKCSYLLTLPNAPDALLKSFKSKLRSQIKKAKNNGIVIQTGGLELCESFFDIYSHNMHRLGSPCLPRELFSNLLDSGSAGDRKVYLAKLDDGTTVGAAFVVEYEGFCEVCWASTLQEFNNLSPNMLIYWAMLEDAVTRGCRVFSFGRSSRGASTEKFKLQWDPETIELKWSSSAKMGNESRNTRAITSFWKLLPYKLTLPLGARITHYVC